MGNIISHHSTNVIDSFVLRLARVIDSVLRNINRRLSTLSSFFFSRVFGYDVVFTSDPAPAPTSGEGGPLICGPGNVCLVPASRLQQRQLEKKRRSERRKRAEAAALGHELVRKAREKGAGGRYEKVESTPSSPVVERDWEKERVMESLGEVARAPPARTVEERETVGEREKGKLWVMGNVQPRHHSNAVKGGLQALPEAIPGEKTIDKHVVNRLLPSPSTNPAANIGGNGGIHIQPRKSSRPPRIVSAKQDAVVQKQEVPAEARFDSGHLTTRKPIANAGGLHQPTAVRLPPGALSLGPSPWEPAFRHPFSTDHEQLPALTSKAKQHFRRQVLDTHLESSPLPHATAPFTPPPTTTDDSLEEEEGEISHLAAGISRPPSRTRTPGAGMARSFDAISLRSVDSSHTAGGGAIDVKTLASKAVKEEKGRKVWKDHVNKFAMQRCLQQQVQGERRLSAATLAGVGVGVGVSDKALTRVRTQEGEAGGLAAGDRGLGGGKGRRGSSPALGVVTAGMVGSRSVGANGRTTPVLRAESPLHAVVRS